MNERIAHENAFMIQKLKDASEGKTVSSAQFILIESVDDSAHTSDLAQVQF